MSELYAVLIILGTAMALTRAHTYFSDRFGPHGMLLGMFLFMATVTAVVVWLIVP